MNNIIDSIQNMIHTKIEQNAPIVIYIGIGTFAGLTTQIGEDIIMEDKNYHQFPPCIQKIYMDNIDMHLFIILIDPIQEDPIYIVTDPLKREYFPSEWIHSSSGLCEAYDNNRITIYPFRHAVKTKINNDASNIDITDDLFKLNELCILNNMTLIYHDFSGQDTAKNLEKYFEEQIGSHLDTIVYGIGGGNISGCYYDFTRREAFLASMVCHERRKIIKVFSPEKTLRDFSKSCDNRDFLEFLTASTEKFGYENIDIIQSQIQLMNENFKFKFKNYVMYVMRILKDYNDALLKKIEDIDKIKDIEYYLKKIDCPGKIKDLIETKDVDIFNKALIFFSEYFLSEITLILMDTRYSGTRPFEILKLITSDPDKYKWLNTFNKIFE